MNHFAEDDELDLLEYWEVLWHKRYLIVSLCLIAVIATMILSLMAPKRYESETVFISSASESGGLGAALSAIPLAGVLAGAAGVQTSADKIMVVLKSRTVAELVVNHFNLIRVFNEQKWDAKANAWKDPSNPPLLARTIDVLMNNIVTFEKTKDGALSVKVEWTDPKLAAAMANYYVHALTEFLKEKSISITIQVIDKAVPADQKSSPKIKKNMIISGFASLFLGIFIAFFLNYIENLKKARAAAEQSDVKA